ncbi:MAG: adenine phosphoribosyltransferase [Malacoplasma sp.]
MTIKEISETISSVEDFPKKGIVFRDITPIFYDFEKVEFIIDKFVEFANTLTVDVIVAAESRGYLIGLPLAMKLKKPFIMVRKKGKLPRKTISVDYELEYGHNTLEIHEDAIKPGQKVLLVDDLIATGGTSLAIEKLIHRLNGVVVGQAYLIELKDLCDRDKLEGKIFSLIQY